MNPKQKLIDIKIKSQQQKYPNFQINAIPIPKYSDATANGLTKMIVDFINLSGGQAERINTMGRVVMEKKEINFYTNKVTGGAKYIPTTGRKGSADISATICGLSVKIEVKIGKDRQSDYQKDYEQSIVNAGGIYFIAKTFDDFFYWYKNKFDKSI